jgi:hypothetical protein
MARIYYDKLGPFGRGQEIARRTVTKARNLPSVAFHPRADMTDDAPAERAARNAAKRERRARARA